jgi:ubiquinol-cytochrome c reductase cytochrome c subunit
MRGPANRMNNLPDARKRGTRISGFPFAFRVLALAGYLVLPALGASDPASAKGIFEKRCTGCHTFGKGVKVGPDLKGVTERHDRGWLLKFIRSSSSVIQSGDPAAVSLFQQFKKERMPDWTDFTPEQIGSIIDYFAADGPLQKEPDERHANTATVAEIAGGQRLFQGKTPLSAGGASCATCHSIHGAGWGRGGSLGPDLTATYFKYQDKALTDFLKHPCFKSAAKTSAGYHLTPQESFNLKAYMAKIAGLAIPTPTAAPVQTAQTGPSPESKRSFR